MTASAPTAPAVSPANRPSRRRRLLRIGVILLVLAVVFRFSINVVAPLAVNVAAGWFGLTCQYENLDLGLLSGEARIWGLQVAAAADETTDETATEAPPPYLQVAHAHVNLDVLALFTGSIRVRDLQADGVVLRIERDEEGALLLLRHLPETAADPEAGPDNDAPVAEVAAADDGAEREPVDLRLPIEIVEARFQHVRVDIIDASTEPAISTWLDAHVRLRDVGSPDRPADIQVYAHGPDLVDRAAVQGRIEALENALAAEFHVDVRGLHPAGAAPWLATLGIAPSADEIGFAVDFAARVTPAAAGAGGVDLSLEARNVNLWVDDVPHAGVDEFSLVANSVTAESAHLPSITVTGVRAQAERRPGGILRIAGVDIGALPIAPADTSNEPESDAPARIDLSLPAFRAVLELVRAEKVQLQLHDSALEPAHDVELAIDRAEVRDVVIDPAGTEATAPFDVRARFPGVAESATVSGNIVIAGASANALGEAVVTGVTLAALAPYLRQVGFEPTLERGTLHCGFEAGARAEGSALHGSLSVRDAHYDDGDELFRLGELAVRDVLADLHGPRFRIGAINVNGARLPVRRDNEGKLHALGLHTIEPVAAPQVAREAATELVMAATAEREADEAPLTFALPRLELGKFTCRDVEITARDEFLAPAVDLGPIAVEADMEDLAVGGEPGSGETTTGKISARATVRGIAERFEIAGTMTSRPGPLDVALDLTVEGQAIDTGPLKEYVKPAGFEPALAHGRLHAEIAAELSAHPEGLDGQLTVRNVELAERDTAPYVQLAGLRVGDVAFRPGLVRIGSIVIDQPGVRIGRDADGMLRVALLRLLEGEFDPSQTPAARVADLRSPAAGLENLRLPALEITHLELREARVHLHDAAIEPPVTLELVAEGTADGIASVPDAKAAPFQFTLRSEGTLDEARIEGQVELRPADLRATARVSARGLRAGPLAAYLPPEFKATLQDGRVEMGLEASLAQAEGGELAIGVAMRDFDFRDGEAGDSLLRCAAIELTLPRVAPQSGDITIQTAAVRGVEMTARRTGPLAFETLGISFDPTRTADTQPASEPIAQATEAALPAVDAGATPPQPTAAAGDGAAPDSAAPDAAAPAAVAPDAVPIDAAAEATAQAAEIVAAHAAITEATTRATTAAKSALPLPRIHLESLDLELTRFSFVDVATGTPGQPVELSGKITTTAPTTLLAEHPEDLPPLKFRAEGAFEPFAGAIAVDVEAAPWRPDAEFSISFEATQIRGAPLTDVLPELAGQIDGSDLANGTLTGLLRGRLQLQRRSAIDIDLTRGFGAELAIENVALRGSPDGEVLAGVETVLIEVPRVSPKGDVHISSIDIANIRGRARRDAEGLHALGLTIPLPAPGGEATAGEPAAEEPPTEEPAQTPPTAPVPADRADAEADIAPETPDLRIDQIYVHGLDFVIVDEAVEPPALIPLTNLDINVERFSTHAIMRGRPVRFQGVVAAGEIPLPVRHGSSSALAGAVSSAGKLVAGEDDEVEVEQRPLMDEFALQGQIALFPAPHGRLSLSLIGLELGAFRGLAKDMGISLADGVFDAGIEVRMRDDSIYTAAAFTFANLDVSEEPGGPISTYLSLPAPLQTVVFVLRDEAGEIHIPLNIEVKGTDIAMSQIMGAAVSAFGTLAANAIVASPFRIGGTFTGLVGLEGDEEPPVSEHAVEVSFAEADTGVSAAQREQLRAVSDIVLGDDELVLELRHALGTADLDRIRLLVNPTREQTLEIIARLRMRRDVLARRRAETAAETLALHSVGTREAVGDATERLRAVHYQLGETEQALDGALAMVRPGAERRGDRRARAGIATVANRRLELVRAALLEIGGEDLTQRIEIRPPRLEVQEGLTRGMVLVTPKERKVQPMAEETGPATESAEPVAEPEANR